MDSGMAGGEKVVGPGLQRAGAKKPADIVRVLIVEDVPTIAASLQATLVQAGMESVIAVNGTEALERKSSFKPDVVLVDLELPDVSGLSLVSQLAASGDCGVIVVTANGAEATRVAGLETGADDYVVKPVPGRELTARIMAVHRRMNRPPASRPQRIFIDYAHRALVNGDGRRTTLTEAELAALDTLLDAIGASVSREWLSRVALKRPLHADDRSVDQLVMKLRRKATSIGAPDRVILSARRQGYMISDPTLFRPLNPEPPKRVEA